mmetsp:Transcript_49153/g.110657  ORF Transcript_49153/g.110657 Transcript_49153/m.110657 type:complete len:117 (+) Transcript_49153:100-450(+)
MASFLFLGFLTTQKPVYEDRVFDEEGPRLRDLWADMEQKCFQKYLDEINDDMRGVHAYEMLKHEVSECKKIMMHDNRREVMRDCTTKVVSIYKRCTDTGPVSGQPARGGSSSSDRD